MCIQSPIRQVHANADKFIVAGLIGSYNTSWQNGGNKGAGWVAVVFIWIYIVNFAYSWGPCAWIVVSEVFPLSMRSKGVSIGGSANWLNNFAIGVSTSDFIKATDFGTFIFFGVMTSVSRDGMMQFAMENAD